MQHHGTKYSCSYYLSANEVRGQLPSEKIFTDLVSGTKYSRSKVWDSSLYGIPALVFRVGWAYLSVKKPKRSLHTKFSTIAHWYPDTYSCTRTSASGWSIQPPTRCSHLVSWPQQFTYGFRRFLIYYSLYYCAVHTSTYFSDESTVWPVTVT